ncbi:MAG TPA: hypothetical protein VK686_04120 [Bryobacteraceae bacterium]|jgi:hypothetical protein|nr:hypothetical protein [Bryobacteraceae bacterium]
MATRRRKIAKPAKKASAKKSVAKKKTRVPAIFQVDLSAFPAESVISTERWLCVACVWQIFTKAMSLAPKTALAEIKRYTPSFEELTSAEPVRPFFAAQDQVKAPCPFCGSPAKWHARIATHRIESGKATDTLRRTLVKSLPKSDGQFVVLEQKATQQHAFFEWLEKIGENLDLDDPAWLRDVSLHYLGRKEPKVNWTAEFAGVHSIRRSRRLGPEEESTPAWQVERGRLFLAPMLFDELLLVQYLVSRSQLAGGLTLERRYTLPELWHRLRHSGYLHSIDVQANNPSDALEQMLAHLSGGEASARYYYIVDRREHLQKVKALQTEKPRARAAGR